MRREFMTLFLAILLTLSSFSCESQNIPDCNCDPNGPVLVSQNGLVVTVRAKALSGEIAMYQLGNPNWVARYKAYQGNGCCLELKVAAPGPGTYSLIIKIKDRDRWVTKEVKLTTQKVSKA